MRRPISRRAWQVALVVNLMVLVGLMTYWLTIEVSDVLSVAIAALLVFLVGINLALLEYTRK